MRRSDMQPALQATAAVTFVRQESAPVRPFELHNALASAKVVDDKPQSRDQPVGAGITRSRSSSLNAGENKPCGHLQLWRTAERQEESPISGIQFAEIGKDAAWLCCHPAAVVPELSGYTSGPLHDGSPVQSRPGNRVLSKVDRLEPGATRTAFKNDQASFRRPGGGAGGRRPK